MLRLGVDPSLADRIVARYPRASAFQRWHMRGRLHLCPYDKILPHLDGAGALLDIGCGFGHLAWLLRESGSPAAYYGTDVDERKIAVAREAQGADPGGPVFLLGDARAAAGLPERFTHILFLDVLYLMPWELQTKMLAWAMDRLAPGDGNAILAKTLDAAEGLSGFRAMAEEWVMVRLLRRTRASGTLNGMRPFPEYAAFARERGFRCEIESLGTYNPSSLLRFTR